MKKLFLFLSLIPLGVKAQYAPGVEEIGTQAIHKDSSAIIAWANEAEIYRGYLDIEDTMFAIGGSNRASFGSAQNAVGPAEGNAMDVVSLGDGGEAVLFFNGPILNGPGADFAVFENSFASDYLELAYVEVSSDGVNFVRFPSHSLTQTQLQISGFGNLDPTKLHNLAGKYKGGYGTPFDLEELQDSLSLDLNNVRWVKIVDVVGSIGDSARYDSQGNKINDPYPTPYESGGFDLDGVAQLHGFVHIDEVELVQLRLYPNPTKGALNIIAQKEIEAVKVYNLKGQIVQSFSTQQKELEIVLPQEEGIYIVEVLINGETIRKRVVKLNG